MCQEETVFIAPRCFPAVEGTPNWLALSPRISAIYDLAGDGKTALKFTANRYNIPVGNTLQRRSIQCCRPITLGPGATTTAT